MKLKFSDDAIWVLVVIAIAALELYWAFTT